MIAALVVWLATAPAEPPPCVEAASEAHRVGRVSAAAADAERCWLATRHPRALLVAVQAWVYLHHHAHAALALDRYREHDDDEPALLRQAADELANRIATRTGTLELRLDPPARPDEGIRFELTRPDDIAPPLRGVTSALGARDGVVRLRLDAGRWQITLEREGYVPLRQELTVVVDDGLAVTARTRPLAGPGAFTSPVAPTRVQLGPARALRRGVVLRLRRPDDPSVRAVEISTSTSEIDLYLPPGPWQLETRARGFAASTTAITAGEGPFDVQLRRRTAP